MTEPSTTTPLTRSLPAGPVSPAYLPTLGLANFGVYLALLTPVFVSLAFKLEHITANRGESVAALSLVMGVGTLFAIIFNPLVGRLSDRTMSRFGMRRPWLIAGAVVGFAALVTIGLASEVWMVLVGWCVAQAALNGTLAALNATIADRMPVWKRGLASGIVGITTSLGILGGTFAVNFLASDFSRFAVPALIGLVLTVLFAMLLKDGVRLTPPATSYGWRDFAGSFVFNPRKNPDFGWTWLTTFLVMFGYAGIATYLPLYLTDKFLLTEAEAITAVLICNLAAVGAQAISGPLAGYLSDKLGRRKPFVLAAGIIMVAGLVVLAFAPTVEMVIVGQGLIGLGIGSFLSVSLALATQVLPDAKDTAKDLGVINIANALPQSIAPAIAPGVIALGAATAIGGYSLFYLVGAAAALAGALLIFRVKGTK